MKKNEPVYVVKPQGGKTIQGKEIKPEFEGKKQGVSEEEKQFIGELKSRKR